MSLVRPAPPRQIECAFPTKVALRDSAASGAGVCSSVAPTEEAMMTAARIDPNQLDLTLGRLRTIPESAIEAMMASLRAKGFLNPMIAASREGRPMLVDGFVRRAAAVRIGLERVPVELLTLSPIEMKAQMVVRNRERGLHLIEECRVVRDLVEADKLSQVEVSDLLERHESWVSRRLSLIRCLSPHLVEEVVMGELPPGCVKRLALLPARNQEEIWAAARRTKLSPTQTRQLVDLWRAAPSSDARAWLLEHPVESLAIARGEQKPALDARLGRAGEDLRRSLDIMRRAALRARRRLNDGLGEICAAGREILADTRSMTADECTSALAELRDWLATQDAAEVA